MNANVPMLDEVAGNNTKEVIEALNKTIRQQKAEIEALKEFSKKAEQHCLDAFERGKQIGYAEGMISRKASEK